MVSTIGVIIIGLVCLAAGLGIGIWYAGMSSNVDAAKAEAVQDELDRYRKQVDEHFMDTAKHFAAIGQEYRSLYEHMASGAETLLSGDAEISRLGFPRIATGAASSSDDTPSTAEVASKAGETATAEQPDDETQHATIEMEDNQPMPSDGEQPDQTGETLSSDAHPESSNEEKDAASDDDAAPAIKKSES